MQRIILLVLISNFSLLHVFSQCTEPSEPKVLLVGDSWAFFMNSESTINSVFKTWGHSNYTFVSNSTLSVSGARTNNFLQPAAQAEILHQLTINPTINVVHLSIGGNDFLGGWNVNFTQGQTDTLMNVVFGKLDSIIRFIKSCKPGIQIFWSGYVYPNFGEVLSSNPSLNPFYSTWQGMGEPTFIQINTILNNVSARMDSMCLVDPQLHFVKCTGLMQYLYGQIAPLAVAPGGTYPQYSVPLPLGNPNYPSPKAAMLDYVVFKDCFHLSPASYVDFISYHTQKFYQKFLMDDKYLLADSTQSGSVSAQGNVSNSLQVGEAGGDNFATLLSFNTTTMADTTLRKASIFLRRNNLTGNNPITGNIVVGVKSGNFGTTVNVEAADYSAPADASGNPCLFGSYANDGDWVRLDLPVSVLRHINHSSITQFLITAPGVTGAKANYYNSSNPDYAPVLNLAYGQTPNGINEISNEEFSIYPNPSTGLLTVESGAEVIKHVEVSNLLGEVVLRPQMQQHNIDISSLASGMYVLNITTAKGRTSQKVVKE